MLAIDRPCTRGRRFAHVVGIWTLASIGCSGTSTPSTDWQRALVDLQSHGTAIYSFRFTGPPPDGMFLHAAISGGDSGAACARYAATSLVSQEDYWSIDVELGDAVQGAYTVTSDDLVGIKGSHANVDLLHRYNGAYVADYKATAGTVALAMDATTDAAKTGMTAVTDLDVQFPAQAVQRLVCQGGGAVVDGEAVGAPMNECMCQNASGSTWTCVPEAGKGDCCVSQGGPSVAFKMHLSASPCAGMCRIVVGLTDYCALVR